MLTTLSMPAGYFESVAAAKKRWCSGRCSELRYALRDGQGCHAGPYSLGWNASLDCYCISGMERIVSRVEMFADQEQWNWGVPLGECWRSVWTMHIRRANDSQVTAGPTQCGGGLNSGQWRISWAHTIKSMECLRNLPPEPQGNRNFRLKSSENIHMHVDMNIIVAPC